MTGILRSLLRLRGDEDTAQALRQAWTELNIGWHKGMWRAWPWDGSPDEAVATGRTPDELRTAIREAWVATGGAR